MVSFYSPLFAGGLLFALAGWRSGREQPWRRLPIRSWLLVLVPIILDGFTHMISDAVHPVIGFRDSNAWLAELTNNAFARAFYAGDAISSFNWWMQLFTGLLAGFATVWLVYPRLADAFAEMRESLEKRLDRTA